MIMCCSFSLSKTHIFSAQLLKRSISVSIFWFVFYKSHTFYYPKCILSHTFSQKINSGNHEALLYIEYTICFKTIWQQISLFEIWCERIRFRARKYFQLIYLIFFLLLGSDSKRLIKGDVSMESYSVDYIEGSDGVSSPFSRYINNLESLERIKTNPVGIKK